MKEVAPCNCARNHWNITFMRAQNDWEEESIISLLVQLNVKIVPDGNGKNVQPKTWMGTSLLRVAAIRFKKGQDLDSSSGAVRKSKACFPAWVVIRGNIPMKDMVESKTTANPSN